MGIKEGWRKFKQGAKRVLGKVWNGIKTGARWAWDKLKKGANFVVNGVKKVGGWIIKNPDQAKTLISTIGSAVKMAAGAG